MKNSSILLILGVWVLSFSLTAQTESLQELVYKKQYFPAIERSKTFNQTDSADFNTMYLLGQAYEGLLKYRDALRAYQHCYQLDSLNSDLLTTMARTAINLGQAKLAENCFNKILETDSNHFYANYQLGRLYYQLGEIRKAVEKFNFLLEQDEENSALLKNMGDCYYKLDNYQEAFYYYYQAYEQNKENAALAGTLINLMLRMGDEFAEDALIVCDTALYYNPTNKPLQQNKAMALYINKKYPEADTLYTRLLMSGDSTYVTMKYGGASRYYAGQQMQAIELLQPAYYMDSTSVDVTLLLGSSFGRTYDRPEALRLLDRAEDNMQPNPHFLRQLAMFRAETYDRDGKWEKAAHYYYKAWEMTGRSDLLAKICFSNIQNDHEKYADEKSKQRGLHALVWYCNETFDEQEDPYDLYFFRNKLEKFREEMFFRNMESYTMLAPDGKKTQISAEKLNQLIEKIPTSSTKK